MKRSMVAVLATAVVLVSPCIAAESKTAPAPAPWPLALGPLDSVPRRFPVRKSNAASARLKLLAARIGIDFTPGSFREASTLDRRTLRFLEAQIARGDDRIDPLPGDVEAFFRSNAQHIDAIRDLLISDPVVWPVDLEHERVSMPNPRAHTFLARILVARALAHSSWNDLRAAASLAGSLSPRPELVSQIVSTSIMRLVLTAARKLPRPVPPWAMALTQVDPRRNIIGAIQAETWWIDQEFRSAEHSPSVMGRLEDIIMQPFDELFAADFVELARNKATELAASRQCAFDGDEFSHRMRSDMSFWNRFARNRMPDIGWMWQRIARLTAERESAAIVLQLKSGKKPELRSGCSDGSWSVARDGSGTHVRFSRRIPVRPPATEIPLDYTIH